MSLEQNCLNCDFYALMLHFVSTLHWFEYLTFNCSITGVDVILDNIGASYLQRNIESLSLNGRLFIIGFMGGTVTEINLSSLLAKRLTVQGNILQRHMFLQGFYYARKRST